MPMTQARAARFVRRASLDFDAVEDPRSPRGKRHPLRGLLNLVVAAMACGQLTFRGVEEFAELLPARLRRRLGARGAPSDTASYELIARLGKGDFRSVVRQQVRADLASKAITHDLFPIGVISIDGKGAGGGLGEPPNKECRPWKCDQKDTPCWSYFVLRACLTSSLVSPVLDQEVVHLSEGESTVFPRLLDRLVADYPRLFEIVSADAGITSREDARRVRQHDKHYAFVLKQSFGKLHPRAVEVLGAQPVVALTRERSHGREVVRELRRAPAPAGFDFPDAKEIWSVRHVETGPMGKVVLDETRVILSSMAPGFLSDDQALALVRLHWRIENGPHWMFDMLLEEDSHSPCGIGDGLVVMSWLRILAHNLVSVLRAHLPKKDHRLRSWKNIQLCALRALWLVAEGTAPPPSDSAAVN